MGNILYTTDEVAEHYRVARRTVYRWVRDGWLTGTRYGRAFLFSEEDIRKFEEGYCGK
jgi:excisionase family DNA binding protein